MPLALHVYQLAVPVGSGILCCTGHRVASKWRGSLSSFQGWQGHAWSVGSSSRLLSTKEMWTYWKQFDVGPPRRSGDRRNWESWDHSVWRRLVGDLTSVCKYLAGRREEGEPDHFQWCLVSGQEVKGIDRNPGFVSAQGSTSALREQLNTGTSCPEAVEFPPWRPSKAAWTWLWAPCSGCPWRSRDWARWPPEVPSHFSYPVNKEIILWVKKHWWHQFCCHRITPLITRWHWAVLVLEYPLQDVCSKGWHMFCAINELDRQRWNKANRRVSVNDISKFALFNSFFFLNYSVFKYSRLITWHTPALLPTLVELLLSCKQELL